MNCPMKIVLISASVRPLIASCLQAKYVPVAFDFFADWDGRRLIEGSSHSNASLTKIDCYRDLLELDFKKLGDAAIFAGGAELQSDLVRAVSKQLPLLGPSAESLATVADPVVWLRALQAADCRVPETRRELPINAKPDDWLRKQSGTCGGSGVRLIGDTGKDCDDEIATNSYFQKRIPGQAWSTILVSRAQTENHPSATFSLGCTRQWLAADFADESEGCRRVSSWSRQTSGRHSNVSRILANPATSKSHPTLSHHARPFAYRGSVGPLAIPTAVQIQIDRIANLLAREFSMRGVWGMDFVLDGNGHVWPVDLNPRITASTELFESTVVRSRSKFRSVIDLHLSACSISSSDREEFEKLADDCAASLGSECETKRILFNTGPNAIEIDNTKCEQLSRYHKPRFFQSNQTNASIADVPKLGDRIEPEHPLLTIRSRAKTEAAAIALLDELFDAVQTCVGCIC